MFQIYCRLFWKPQSELPTEKRVKTLIDEVKSIHYEKLHSRKDELRNTATDFLGKFSENNIFKFKKLIPNESALLAFAEMLSDFVEERKIERIEKEVNERLRLLFPLSEQKPIIYWPNQVKFRKLSPRSITTLSKENRLVQVLSRKLN